MKKLLLLFGGLMLVPLVSLTAGQSSPPILDNSSSFQVADAIKLGLSDDGLILKPKKALSGDDKLDGTDGNFEEFCSKGYYYDKVTKACKLNDVCNPNNPCSGTTPVCEPAGDGINYTCLCNNSSCGPGKTCTGGTCYNCQKGEKCNCSGTQVSDGNGGCYTPNDTCNPNPCSGETPSCSALDETQYSCSCTSTSCPAGKKCEDMTCQACSAGEDCGCKASGKEADGNGGCRCPGMKIESGNSCVCPSCYAADGTWGGCKKTCECVTCADAKKCVDGECVNCPLGEDCGCFDDDAYSNGSGVCEPNDPCANVTCDSSWHCDEGECVADACPSGYTAGKTCGEGYNTETNGKSGGEDCVKCVEIPPECTTQEDCAVGEECLSNKCKPCGNNQGSMCASFCKQGSGPDWPWDCSGGSGGSQGSSGGICLSGAATASSPTNCPQGYGWGGRGCVENSSDCEPCYQGSALGGYCNCPVGTKSSGKGSCCPQNSVIDPYGRCRTRCQSTSQCSGCSFNSFSSGGTYFQGSLCP